jgi:salicylate 5-hydroxylase small subunit
LTRELVRRKPVAADTVQLDELLGAYAAAVDAQNWQGWLDLFAAECSYAVYTLQNAEAGLPLGYTIDDRRERLVDRVKFITEVWAGTIEPYRTRHIIQRVLTECTADGAYKVRANMIVSYTESDGPAGILVSGYYEDVIRMTEDGPRFVAKTVYLDGTPTRYLAYPL